MSISFPFFPDGKTKAFTLSYDDGVFQDIRLLELINRYGLKATFHINAGPALRGGGNRIPLHQIREVYQGHEVSAHSVNHPFLTRLTLDQMAWEILEDRRLLEEASGELVRGMSYPYGAFNTEVSTRLPAYGIEYARTTQAHGNFSIPENFLQWHPTCHHRLGAAEKLEEFAALDRGSLHLFYLWGHSYEFDQNVPNNNWEYIESLLARAGELADSVWFATNLEIYDYINALKRVRSSVNGKIVENQSHQTVCIAVGNEPVTLKPGQRLTL